MLCAWAVCLVWTVGYSALFGYGAPGTEGSLVLGVPSWVFYGVLLPWVVATRLQRVVQPEPHPGR